MPGIWKSIWDEFTPSMSQFHTAPTYLLCYESNSPKRDVLWVKLRHNHYLAVSRRCEQCIASLFLGDFPSLFQQPGVEQMACQVASGAILVVHDREAALRLCGGSSLGGDHQGLSLFCWIFDSNKNLCDIVFIINVFFFFLVYYWFLTANNKGRGREPFCVREP